MIYLTRDELLDLHMVALQRYGGRLGIRSQDWLLAAVNAPALSMFGAELYPDLASKTAALGFMLLKNRPFNGGNEVTAMLAVLRMLDVNGIDVTGKFPAKLAAVLHAVMQSDLDRDELTAWLLDEIGAQQPVAHQ